MPLDAKDADSRDADSVPVTTFEAFARRADYSFIAALNADPDATADGHDRQPRQVFSGHFVPVAPTPIAEPAYVTHSHQLFKELGLADELATDDDFRRVFSGDLSAASGPMRKLGWATGYALSIYGTEYTQQCPFRTGNGYGDGRAISVFEGEFDGQRWEMQLKGGGPTPYCRGGDGRAVLRSSVREFLAQEHMHALGIPTSRSLTLYTSHAETVVRPWYSEGARSPEPDVLVDNPVAISTRVAPSFIRVGQLELFARRARNGAHPGALDELRLLVSHLIEREYRRDIDPGLPFAEQVVQMASLFRDRLCSLVADWVRVGYCQGNFNSDNCAAGGMTLDYGPFGFCEVFDPFFQPWTGGGRHFSLLNQPRAAEANYHMFHKAVRLLVADDSGAAEKLDEVRDGFATVMQAAMEKMWAAKLGLDTPRPDVVEELLRLLCSADVDFPIFFRELSGVPTKTAELGKSFYAPLTPVLETRWDAWLKRWRDIATRERSAEALATIMKQVNPKYVWREWLIVPAYQQAMKGDYAQVRELQQVLGRPYDEQSPEVEAKHYAKRPRALFSRGGVSHYTCSS
jgi:uncharacterized protein YdiU (UPF0061 family)